MSEFLTGLTGFMGLEDKDLTERVIGCAMKVHRGLGAGFLESVYKNALIYELTRAGIHVEAEQRLTVRYEGVVVGEFIADLLVEERLIVELKANAALTKIDEVQTVNYLAATHHEFGLLINFGAPSLEFRRKYCKASSPLPNPVNPVNPV
jgi:GxxExxY protein